MYFSGAFIIIMHFLEYLFYTRCFYEWQEVSFVETFCDIFKTFLTAVFVILKSVKSISVIQKSKMVV